LVMSLKTISSIWVRAQRWPEVTQALWVSTSGPRPTRSSRAAALRQRPSRSVSATNNPRTGAEAGRKQPVSADRPYVLPRPDGRGLRPLVNGSMAAWLRAEGLAVCACLRHLGARAPRSDHQRGAHDPPVPAPGRFGSGRSVRAIPRSSAEQDGGVAPCRVMSGVSRALPA
jgi:hypothetical protein